MSLKAKRGLGISPGLRVDSNFIFSRRVFGPFVYLFVGQVRRNRVCPGFCQEEHQPPHAALLLSRIQTILGLSSLSKWFKGQRALGLQTRLLHGDFYSLNRLLIPLLICLAMSRVFHSVKTLPSCTLSLLAPSALTQFPDSNRLEFDEFVTPIETEDARQIYESLVRLGEIYGTLGTG